MGAWSPRGRSQHLVLDDADDTQQQCLRPFTRYGGARSLHVPDPMRIQHVTVSSSRRTRIRS